MNQATPVPAAPDRVFETTIPSCKRASTLYQVGTFTSLMSVVIGLAIWALTGNPLLVVSLILLVLIPGVIIAVYGVRLQYRHYAAWRWYRVPVASICQSLSQLADTVAGSTLVEIPCTVVTDVNFDTCEASIPVVVLNAWRDASAGTKMMVTYQMRIIKDEREHRDIMFELGS